MEQQTLTPRPNHTIQGNLTEAQIAQLVEMAQNQETITVKINGFSVDITVGDWQKDDLHRLYINKSHGSKAARQFGSHRAFCWIDPANGSINAPDKYSQMNEVATMYALAELFGLEVYRGGGLRAVAE